MAAVLPYLFAFLIAIGVVSYGADGALNTDLSTISDPVQRIQVEDILSDPANVAYAEKHKNEIELIHDNNPFNAPMDIAQLKTVAQTKSLEWFLEWINSNQNNVSSEMIKDFDHMKFISSSGKYLVITASEPYWWSPSVSGKAIDLNFELYYADGSKIPYSEAHNNLGWLNGQWVGKTWISSDSLSKVLDSIDISKDGVLTFQHDDNIRGRTYRRTIFPSEYYGTSELDITESAVDIGTAVVDGAEKALNSDGSLTLDDGTVIYMNPDGTYTLPDGSVVSPTINFDAYNDSAILDLLNRILEAQNSTDVPADLGILETILNAINTLRRAVVSPLTTAKDLLLNILKKVSSIADNIGFNFDRSNAGSWSDVINAFKNKVGYNNIATSVNNISSGIFGFRTFKTDNNGDLVAVVDGDENSTFSGKVTTPHIYFTYMGVKYDLLASIGAFTSESLAFFKSLVSLFVTVGFALGLFRSIPDILMSAGRLVGVYSYSESYTFDSKSGEFITHPHMSRKW